MKQPSSSNYTSLMAPVMLLVFILAMLGGSDAAWCVCKPEVPSPSLQKTLDYACGAGADCNPIHQNGPCYNPNTVLAHCSYATNSYYQRNGQNQQACDFSGTAQLSQTDPSQPGCSFPATPSAAGTSGSTPNNSPTTPGSPATPGSSATPSSSTTPGSSSSTTGGTFTPNSPTTSTGTNGGIGFGLGPSGVGLDANPAAASLLKNAKTGSVLITSLLLSVLALLKV